MNGLTGSNPHSSWWNSGFCSFWWVTPYWNINFMHQRMKKSVPLLHGSCSASDALKIVWCCDICFATKMCHIPSYSHVWICFRMGHIPSYTLLYGHQMILVPSLRHPVYWKYLKVPIKRSNQPWDLLGVTHGSRTQTIKSGNGQSFSQRYDLILVVFPMNMDSALWFWKGIPLGIPSSIPMFADVQS